MAGHRSTSLMRSVQWFGASYGIAIIGYLGVNAAASRLVGVSDFGRFVVIVNATILLGQLGLLGVHRSGLREAAQLDYADVDRLAELRAGVAAVTTLALPTVSLSTGLVTWLLLDQYDDGSRLWVALLTGILVYLTGQQRLCANFLRGLGHVRVAGLLEGRSGGAFVAVSQTAVVLLILLLWPESGLVGALAGTVAGFALPVLLARAFLGRRWAHTQRQPGRWRNLTKVFRRDWKFVVSQSGAYANSSLELWLAAALLSPFATSMFGASYRLAHLLAIPNTSLQTVFSPAIARMSAQKDRKPLQHLLRTGSSLATVMSALVWLPLVCFPAAILTLVFGADFKDAAAVLVILASGYVVRAMCGLSAVTLSMSHREGVVAIVTWSGLALRVVLGVIAALTWGVIGLAATSVATMLFNNALMWWHVRRLLGVSTHATLRPRLRMLLKVSG